MCCLKATLKTCVFVTVAFALLACVPIAGADAPGDDVFQGVPTTVEGGYLEAVMFYLFGGAVLVSALGVCVSTNIVRMATWLFGTLGSVAVLYLLLGANFLGAIQLIVYAGGTLILLIFGVMLTNKSPWVRFDCSRTEMLAAGGVAGALFLGLVTMLMRTDWPSQAKVTHGASVAELGKALLTTYLVPFEVASVVLLVVMIAAAYLAKTDQ